MSLSGDIAFCPTALARVWQDRRTDHARYGNICRNSQRRLNPAKVYAARPKAFQYILITALVHEKSIILVLLLVLVSR